MKSNILLTKLFFMGLGLAAVLSAAGQTGPYKGATNLGADSVVHLAYRDTRLKDLPGGVSVLNPPQYLDRNYGMYPLEGIDALVAGNNLWNIGAGLVLVDGEPRSLNDVTANEIEQIGRGGLQAKSEHRAHDAQLQGEHHDLLDGHLAPARSVATVSLRQLERWSIVRFACTLCDRIATKMPAAARARAALLTRRCFLRI